MQQQSPKIVRAVQGRMATSLAGEDPMYVVTTGEDGYGFSLTRFRGDALIELMVEDQTNCVTSDLIAELYPDRLMVNVAQEVVAEIGIPSEYLLLLATPADEIQRIDAALTAIFDGVGKYFRRF
jgi:hypothetical protein